MGELLEYATHYLLAHCRLNPICFLTSNTMFCWVILSAGSADIVATASGTDPMLVRCTMAMPDSRKAGLLAATRTAICNRVQLPETWLKMVLVTGKPSVSEKSLKCATWAQRIWCKYGKRFNSAMRLRRGLYLERNLTTDDRLDTEMSNRGSGW